MDVNQDREIVDIYLEDIIPNRFQPRLIFDENNLNELASSIKQHGVIQPIVVRRVGDKYEIIAGERRHKAVTMLGMQKIPAVVIDVDDNISAEMAVVENTQREDLNAIERALSFKKLLDKGYLTQDQLAAKMGTTQATISNTLRLLNLDQEVQDALLNKNISERHARSLLILKNPSDQKEVLNKIVNNKLTVKDTDNLIRSMVGTDTEGGTLPISEEGGQSMVSQPDIPKQQIDINKDFVFEDQPNVIQNNNSETNTLSTSVDSNINNSIPSYVPTPEQGEVNTGDFNIPPIINEEDQPKNVGTVDVNELKENAIDINKVKEAANLNTLLGTSSPPEALKINETNEYRPTFDNAPQNRFIPLFEDEETDMIMEEESPVIPKELPKEATPISFETSTEYNQNKGSNFSSPSSLPNEITSPSPPVTNTDFLIDEYLQNQPSTIVSGEDSKPLIVDLKGAINTIRDTIKMLEKQGLIVDTEEFDFENLYQIIIKINK